MRQIHRYHALLAITLYLLEPKPLWLIYQRLFYYNMRLLFARYGARY